MNMVTPSLNYPAISFTPTLTLVGGAGNTVPVYTTNNGRYVKVGNLCAVSVYLTGDGGAEGAGTGQVNIDLPFTASATSFDEGFFVGTAFNNATSYQLDGAIAASGTRIRLRYWSAVNTLADFTGAQQNNATRNIRLNFFYFTA